MLTFVPHKIKEDYRKVDFFRVNKELCNNEIYLLQQFYYILYYVIDYHLPIIMNWQIIFIKEKNITMMKKKICM